MSPVGAVALKELPGELFFQDVPKQFREEEKVDHTEQPLKPFRRRGAANLLKQISVVEPQQRERRWKQDRGDKMIPDREPPLAEVRLLPCSGTEQDAYEAKVSDLLEDECDPELVANEVIESAEHVRGYLLGAQTA